MHSWYICGEASAAARWSVAMGLWGSENSLTRSWQEAGSEQEEPRELKASTHQEVAVPARKLW